MVTLIKSDTGHEERNEARKKIVWGGEPSQRLIKEDQGRIYSQTDF